MGARSRYIALKYLNSQSDVYRKQYPQVVGYTFDLITNLIMVDGRYENEQLEALKKHIFPKLKHRRICLDIGANIGNHALFFADQFDLVHAFEPHPRTAKILTLNAELSGNIRVHPFGLSDQEAVIQAAAIPGNVATTQIGRSDSSEESVELNIKPLDMVSEIADLNTIDLIKIDVEGHELEALRGAEQTIRNCQPIIISEALQSDVDDGTTEAMEFLRLLGYGHHYTLRSNRPFSSAPKPIARLITGLTGIVLGRRPANNFTIEKITKLERKNHPMVISSVVPLA